MWTYCQKVHRKKLFISNISAFIKIWQRRVIDDIDKVSFIVNIKNYFAL